MTTKKPNAAMTEENLEERYERYRSILKDLTIMSDVFMWIFLCGNTANPADGKPSVRACGNRLCEFTRVMLYPSHIPLALIDHVQHRCL